MMGKVVNLEKPMVMLQKVRRDVNVKVDDEDEEGIEKERENQKEDDDSVKIKTEYIVKAIIRKKILFNKRPRPIVFN